MLVYYKSDSLPTLISSKTVRVVDNVVYTNGGYTVSHYPSQTTTYSESQGGFKTTTTSRDSVKTPNYRLLVEMGSPLPMNPYSFSLRKSNDWVGYLHQWTNVGRYGEFTDQIQNGAWYFPNTTMLWQSKIMSDDDLSSLDRRAINGVINKIKDQKIDVGVALAEADKAFKMVGDTAIKIARSLTALRKGDFTSAANVFGAGLKKRAKKRFDRAYVTRNRPQAIANGWLELQYGWLPLLSDIDGACEELARGPRQMSRQVKKHVKRGNEFKGTYLQSTYSDIYEQGVEEYHVTYIVRYGTANPIAADLVTLGIINPLTIAWELMPYSFVIDWFLPVGNWLSNLNYDSGLTFKDGSKTTFRKITSRAALRNYGYDGSWHYDGVRVKEYLSVDVVRTKLNAFPALPYPSFKNPLSRKHMANGLALLQNLRK